MSRRGEIGLGESRSIAPVLHGGDPAGARRKYRLGDAALVDFSANLNPFGPYPSVIEASRHALDRVGQYPEPGCPRLGRKLAERHAVPAECVLVAAGTTELIGLIARSIGSPLHDHFCAYVHDPCYNEYRRASELAGGRVETLLGPLLEWCQTTFPTGCRGLFWTGNPQNPTGKAWDPRVLPGLIVDSPNLVVVVDESYLPFLADDCSRSLARAATEIDNCIVLRSMTKVHAIPGLRLGYAIGSRGTIERLRAIQDPWTVSAPAEAAGRAALEVEVERSLAWLRGESARVLDRLWDIPGLRPVWPSRFASDPPPLPNFHLASLTTETAWTSIQLHEALARAGFLTRECSDFGGLGMGSVLTGSGIEIETHGHLRIAVRRAAENDALLQTLAQVLKEEPRY